MKSRDFEGMGAAKAAIEATIHLPSDSDWILLLDYTSRGSSSIFSSKGWHWWARPRGLRTGSSGAETGRRSRDTPTTV